MLEHIKVHFYYARLPARRRPASVVMIVIFVRIVERIFGSSVMRGLA